MGVVPHPTPPHAPQIFACATLHAEYGAKWGEGGKKMVLKTNIHLGSLQRSFKRPWNQQMAKSWVITASTFEYEYYIGPNYLRCGRPTKVWKLRVGLHVPSARAPSFSRIPTGWRILLFLIAGRKYYCPYIYKYLVRKQRRFFYEKEKGGSDFFGNIWHTFVDNCIST